MAEVTSLDASWERRLRTYPTLLLLALAAAFVFTIVAGSGSSTASGRVGGDFPAFYSAGSIVADGQIDQLYDPAVQAAAQVDLLGDEDGFIMYPYAPHVAAAYAPLSELPYRAAYVLHTALMVGALIGALTLLRPVIGVLDRWFAPALAATITAYPVFVGVGGGQNTALSLFLIAGAWRAWHDDRDGVAGVFLAVLLFRPQYALPLLGLALLDRRWRTLAVAAVGGVVVWVANAALVGVGWITFWYDGVQPLLEADAEINAKNEIAPIGVLVALFGEATLPVVIGGTISAAIVAALMWLWWRTGLDLTARMAITVAALPLLGPHAIYYDSALLAFTTLVLFDRRLISPTVVVGIWALGLVHLSRDIADTSPLILVIFGVLALAVHRLGASGQPAERSDRVLPSQDSYSVR
ncbi:MAG: glycosyltransferase family 87 protein [Actinomycetota bacterium]